MQDQNNRISVLVVEADGLLRDMLRTVLAAEPRLRVVGVTGDAPEAVRIAAAQKPDVTLVGSSPEPLVRVENDEVLLVMCSGFISMLWQVTQESPTKPACGEAVSPVSL